MVFEVSIWLVLSLVAAVLCVFGVIVVRANKRQRRRLDRDEARIARLPEEYRRHGLPWWASIAGLVLPIAAMIAVGHFWDERAGVLALGLGLVPLAWFALRYEERENDAVMRIVERRAPEMSPSELKQLIDDLEAAHGHGTMAPLRRLLPESSTPQP
jgi:hypothetical protein